MEIIYQKANEGSLGLDRQSALIRREVQALLTLWKTGCLKSKAQALQFQGKNRECSFEANIDNWS